MSEPRPILASTITRERPGDNGAFYVVVLDGARSHALALPKSGAVDVGRDEVCFVSLDHDSVSRRHARLTLPELSLVDLGSKNGTRVDGQPLTEARTLRAGAVVEVGDVTLVVQRGPVPKTAPAPEPEDASASEAMKRVLRAVRCVASDDITVLLLGETGVGKEITAERVHRRSRRRESPFVRVHCAAISETLFEAELFGHDKGSFTGATASKPGLLEAADGGTVFIDEVGELPPHIQVKLLRVLEDRRVRRVGGREERLVDVRFVAATNRDLEQEVADGAFRRDLYFRLSGFTIRIPPLRDRTDEVLPLALTFVRALCEEKGVPVPRLTADFVAALEAYSWPGNVRELKNVVRQALIVSDGLELTAADFPHEELARRASLMGAGPPRAKLDSSDECTRILAALEQTGGNQTAAAKLLGMARRTFIVRLEQYGIARPRKR